MIIPTHNRRRLLARTLHSVLAQRHVDLEVVVVDDGGADDTGRFLGHLPGPPGPLSAAPGEPGRLGSAQQWHRPGTQPLARVPRRRRPVGADETAGAVGRTRAAPEVDGRAPVRSTSYVMPGRPVAFPATRARPGFDAAAGERDSGRWFGGNGRTGTDLGRRRVRQALSNLADWDFYIRLGLAAPERRSRGCTWAISSIPGDGPRRGEVGAGISLSRREVRRERRHLGVERNEENWLPYLAGMAYQSGRRRRASASTPNSPCNTSGGARYARRPAP